MKVEEFPNTKNPYTRFRASEEFKYVGFGRTKAEAIAHFNKQNRVLDAEPKAYNTVRTNRQRRRPS